MDKIIIKESQITKVLMGENKVKHIGPGYVNIYTYNGGDTIQFDRVKDEYSNEIIESEPLVFDNEEKARVYFDNLMRG